MQFRIVTSFLSALVFFAGAAIAAHHYDPNKPVTVSGMVKEVKWEKPYVKIHLSVTNDKGKTQDWELETAAPTVLESEGLARTSVKKGDSITAQGDQELDGSEHMLVGSMTLADGKTIAINAKQKAVAAAPLNDAAESQIPETLPHTASNLPVIGAVGLLALAVGGLLGLVRRLG